MATGMFMLKRFTSDTGEVLSWCSDWRVTDVPIVVRDMVARGETVTDHLTGLIYSQESDGSINVRYTTP